MCPGILKLPEIKNLLFHCNILRNNLVMRLIFCMQVSMKACCKLIVCRWSRIPKVPKIASLQCHCSISKKNLELKLIFCMQSFQKVYFDNLSIKIAYKVDIIIIMCFQITQTSLQYLCSISKKKLGMQIIFGMQINIKVSTSFYYPF